MNPLPSNSAIGLAVVGERLVVVEASLRGEQARWSSTIIDGALGEGDLAASIPTPPRDADIVLVWPMDRLLRRDVALGEQTIEEFKDAVGQTPDAFFPVNRHDGLLWDAHEYTDADGVRRAMVFAARLPEIEPVLSALAERGVMPTRIAPSGAAWSVLRHAHDEAPSTVLEIAARAWSVSEFDGLRWSGMQSGFGPAPADLRERARREGWGVCDWRSAPSRVGDSSAWRPDELTAEHAALGGALLALAPRGETESARAPTVNLLGTPAKRGFRMGPLAWYAAACAAAAIGLLVWNDAANARAQRTADALEVEVARLRPAVERVETLRAQVGSVLTAHERLSELHNSYRSMWATLAELAAVVPDEAHMPSIEFADSGVTATVITPSRSALLSAIERSPMFAGVGQTTGVTNLPTGGEQFGIAFGFEQPAAAPEVAQGGGR